MKIKIICIALSIVLTCSSITNSGCSTYDHGTTENNIHAQDTTSPPEEINSKNLRSLSGLTPNLPSYPADKQLTDSIVNWCENILLVGKYWDLKVLPQAVFQFSSLEFNTYTYCIVIEDGVGTAIACAITFGIGCAVRIVAMVVSAAVIVDVVYTQQKWLNKCPSN